MNFGMNDDYVSNMQKDLRRRLDRLFWTHNEPALHVAKHFDELRNRVDYDAEKQIEKVQEEDKDAIVTVTDKWEKFICIINELEKRTGHHPKPQTPASNVYASLKQRVEAFKDSSSSLDDLEDSYLQLAQEIIDETERVEKSIFGEQTIIYWPPKNQHQLGSLVYFGDIFFSRRDIDSLLSKLFSNAPDTSRFQSSVNQLLVPSPEPCELNKPVLESYSMKTFRRFAEASKFYCIVKSSTKYSGYSAEGSAIEKEFIGCITKDTIELQIKGDECLDKCANLRNFYLSTSCKLEIESRPLECLVPSSATHCLGELIFSSRHSASLATPLLSQFVNLTELKVQATFSRDLIIDLKFLRPLRLLQSLELTLPCSSSSSSSSSWDFSAFKEMTQLRNLKLESTSFFHAEKRPRLSKEALEQILLAPEVEKLELGFFDIDSIDREMFKSCGRLSALQLARSRISDDTNLGFPRLFDNTRGPSCYGLSIKVIHSGIRVLNATNFVGLKSLTELSLTGNLIVDLPCGVFKDLRSLRRLDLDKNRIRHIGVFGKLNELQTLKLDDNPIETIEAKAFTQLLNLRELSLSRCRLKSIDSKMFHGLTDLRELNLRNNLIERIEVVAEDGRRINVAKANLNDEEKELVKMHLFTNLSKLTSLDLSENKLEKLDLNCFSNLTGAHHLYFSSNKINELSGVVGPNLFSFLLQLDLRNNQLTAIDENALPKNLFFFNLAKNNLKQLDDDFFAKFKKLQSVILSENELTWTITEATFASCRFVLKFLYFSLNESIQVTQGAFRQMPQCRILEFDFSGNFFSLHLMKTLRIRRLTPEIVRALKQFPRDQQDSLTILERCYLSGCLIRTLTRKPDWNRELDETLTDLGNFNLSWLPNASKLRELDFSGNLIETLDDPTLFADFKSIFKINLSDNRLSRIHRDLFKSLSLLKNIDLAGNQLSNIDMGLFRHLNSLMHLNLSSNGISVLNLARLFRVCPKLESLNIADNQLDDGSIAESIDSTSCLCLKKFVLANNRFAKMDFVRDITCLKHLDLRGNQIESVMSTNGENVLGRLRELVHLDLSNNKISSLTDEMFIHLYGKLDYFDISGNPDLDSLQIGRVASELI